MTPINHFMLLVLLVFVSTVDIKAFHTNQRVYINIVNKLPDNTDTLTLRCLSQQRKMNTLNLNVNDKYQFDFEDIVSQHHKYYCYFWWGHKAAEIAVFNKTINDNNCGTSGRDQVSCWWMVKQDGFYVSPEQHSTGHHLFHMYGWKERYPSPPSPKFM